MKYITIIIFTALLFSLMLYALDRQDKADCARWNDYSNRYPEEFYYLPWQAEMCGIGGEATNTGDFLQGGDIQSYNDNANLDDQGAPYRNDMQKYGLYPEPTNTNI